MPALDININPYNVLLVSGIAFVVFGLYVFTVHQAGATNYYERIVAPRHRTSYRGFICGFYVSWAITVITGIVSAAMLALIFLNHSTQIL